mmetsp:Transcript_51115/g.159711  ORF Transcript_51115/g.159711 Transcript_51115/m.159711 type:complete len:112 (+) Transcript_51115:104-439(+)
MLRGARQRQKHAETAWKRRLHGSCKEASRGAKGEERADKLFLVDPADRFRRREAELKRETSRLMLWAARVLSWINREGTCGVWLEVGQRTPWFVLQTRINSICMIREMVGL